MCVCLQQEANEGTQLEPLLIVFVCEYVGMCVDTKYPGNARVNILQPWENDKEC